MRKYFEVQHYMSNIFKIALFLNFGTFFKQTDCLSDLILTLL